MNNEPNKKNGAKPAVAHKKNILDDRRIRLALSVLGVNIFITNVLEKDS